MNSRQRMLSALRFEEPDRPPHWELVFQLEQEAFGLTQLPGAPESTPSESADFGMEMPTKDKDALLDRCIEVYARIIDRFQWDALGVWAPWGDADGIAAVRKNLVDTMVGGYVGGGIWSITPDMDWMQFAVELVESPEKIHAVAERRCKWAIDNIGPLIDAGAEFIMLPNDVAFNAGPFISPEQFSEFITPYLARQVRYIKDRGAFAFLHTDGQIMPILDQLISVGADCLQSIDPMAGVDIAEVKKRTHGKLALMGNVQCSLLQDGPEEAIRRSALYCLEHASSGGGYVFSTSNSIFEGLPLDNYEYMLSVFREFNATKQSR